MQKAAVIGQYGNGTEYTTGQAVKTRTITNWLAKHIVNSYGWKRNPFKLFQNVLSSMIRCENIIVLPAENGTKIFIPLISLLNIVFKRQTIYIVVGGWLAEMLKTNDFLRKMTAKFSAIYAETRSLTEELKELGIANAEYLPNCREYHKKESAKKVLPEPLHICTYSRVTEDKGISDAVEICRKANQKIGSNIFHLDIYGAIEHEYEDEFNMLLKENSDIVSYMGVVTDDNPADALVNQFAMLFPTYYVGECMAGTVLDAFSTGTPVIANDWKYNNEIISNRVNGFVYPYRDTDSAALYLIDIYRNHELYESIQRNGYESAAEYSTDNVLKMLAKRINRA